MSETNEQDVQQPKQPEPQLSASALLAMLVVFFGMRRTQELRDEEHKQ